MKTLIRTWLLFLPGILLLTGCNSEPKPVEVAGNVMLDDKTMTDGTIYFQSNDGRPPAQAKITDGRYSLQTPPGEYRVSIQQERDTGKKNMYGDPQMESTVAKQYNVDTTLKATVTAPGPNEQNFKVHSR